MSKLSWSAAAVSLAVGLCAAAPASATLLIVAGGGGGGGWSGFGGSGGNGQATQSGQNGSGTDGGAGGANGSGGGGGTGAVYNGGGGGGWLGNGGNGAGDNAGSGGFGPPSFSGGLGIDTVNGGFGGGGGGGYKGGGGGGGYSGGGGGGGLNGNGGGGGGSYIDSSFTATTILGGNDAPITNTGDGSVTINSTLFSYTGSIQQYTVPSTGLYTITALGGAGGTGYGPNLGGLGASVTGTIMLNVGTVLDIVAGGMGTSGDQKNDPGAGGGGSFVFTEEPASATPEPASLALLGVGLLGLALTRRRVSSPLPPPRN